MLILTIQIVIGVTGWCWTPREGSAFIEKAAAGNKWAISGPDCRESAMV
jgi:hypothetical protein